MRCPLLRSKKIYLRAHAQKDFLGVKKWGAPHNNHGHVPTGAREFQESPEKSRGKGLGARTRAVRMLAMKSKQINLKIHPNPAVKNAFSKDLEQGSLTLWDLTPGDFRWS